MTVTVETTDGAGDTYADATTWNWNENDGTLSIVDERGTVAEYQSHTVRRVFEN